jgi:hypothetical protein
MARKEQQRRNKEISAYSKKKLAKEKLAAENEQYAIDKANEGAMDKGTQKGIDGVLNRGSKKKKK